MKNLLTSVLILGFLFPVFISCKKEKEKQDIYFNSINKEYILIRDVSVLQNSSDSVSLHVDSILNGLINEQIISTGLKSFDLNNDGSTDIQFEIIDLNLFNNVPLPDYLDSMAARVVPSGIQILDNSTYGYPDALETGVQINGDGHWTGNTGVLGTFMNAGQFQGRGDRHLALRFAAGGDYNYGWLKLYCSQHSDTLRIIEFAYNRNKGNSINAGQKE